ncbi:hypothetical protein ADM96_32100 [Burkholderia sp. ST111]|nr:hypothetical protein ADM96_32100 [Burkholderia sp. ST111]
MRRFVFETSLHSPAIRIDQGIIYTGIEGCLVRVLKWVNNACLLTGREHILDTNRSYAVFRTRFKPSANGYLLKADPRQRWDVEQMDASVDTKRPETHE